MASRAQAIVIKEFANGLWLNEGDPPSLNFAPYLRNLDVQLAGGLQKRAPVRLNYSKTSLKIATLSGMYQMMQSDPTDGTKYVVADVNGAQYRLVNYSTGSSTANWTANITANTAFTFGASDAGANWYTHGGTSFQGYRILASSGAATIMGTVFNDNLANPTNGNMPMAFSGTQHLSAYFFLANTWESATAFPNRIRWSHPGRFEDWRSFDKIDVGDAAPILGIYSVKETLLIVKQTSIWVLTGYSPETFTLRRIVDIPNVTITNAIAACANAQKGAFVFVQRKGVFRWDGTTWSDVSGGIKDAIVDGRVFAFNMSLVGDVLYMSSQDPNATTADFSTALSWQYHIPTGVWTHHTAAFTGLCEVSPQSIPVAKAYGLHYLGSTPQTYSFSWYQQQQQAGSWVDNITGSDTAIVAEYRSPWFDGGNPALKKRFRRPRVVFNKRPNASASNPTIYNVTVYKNWDGAHSSKTGTVTALKAPDATDYNNYYGYGHSFNPITGSDFDEGLKLSSLGSGYAFQLKIDSSGTPADQWGFDSVTVPFIPKRLH